MEARVSHTQKLALSRIAVGSHPETRALCEGSPTASKPNPDLSTWANHNACLNSELFCDCSLQVIRDLRVELDTLSSAGNGRGHGDAAPGAVGLYTRKGPQGEGGPAEVRRLQDDNSALRQQLKQAERAVAAASRGEGQDDRSGELARELKLVGLCLKNYGLGEAHRLHWPAVIYCWNVHMAVVPTCVRI